MTPKLCRTKDAELVVRCVLQYDIQHQGSQKNMSHDDVVVLVLDGDCKKITGAAEHKFMISCKNYVELLRQCKQITVHNDPICPSVFCHGRGSSPTENP
jgi:hypothetical protein